MPKWEIKMYEKVDPSGIGYLTVERVNTSKDGKNWAVRCRGGLCLSKRGKWEYEPMPSSRTGAFKKRCRFDTAREAMTAADKVKKPF